MYCPRCGTPHTDQATYCTKCGNQLARQPVYAMPAAAPVKTNGLAIASFVVSIAGLCIPVLGGLVGLILGIIAMSQLNKKPKTAQGHGFAIAGICISSLGLFLSIMLFPLLIIPRVTQANERARVSSLKGELYQMRTAIASFAADTGHFPKTANLSELTVNYDPTTGGPIEGWYGPYLKKEENQPGIDANSAIPQNVFADSTDITVESNWRYSPDSGKVESAISGVHAGEEISNL